MRIFYLILFLPCALKVIRYILCQRVQANKIHVIFIVKHCRNAGLTFVINFDFSADDFNLKISFLLIFYRI